MGNTTPSQEFIEYICDLYGDVYDDRIEDCRPPAAGEEFRKPGKDWVPGQFAEHKSLNVFQGELEAMGIKLSKTKIHKILISGGCWTTYRSREILRLLKKYTKPAEKGGEGMSKTDAYRRIADELGISLVSVSVNLPYHDVVHNLDNKSSNAKRCKRYRERKQDNYSQYRYIRRKNQKKPSDS